MTKQEALIVVVQATDFSPETGSTELKEALEVLHAAITDGKLKLEEQYG